MKILIVDNITERISFFLEKFSTYNIDIADSVEVAIDFLLANKYDFMFIGGVLSKGGGYGSDVVEFIKDNNINVKTVIIHTWNLNEVESIMEIMPTAIFIPFSETIYDDLRL